MHIQTQHKTTTQKKDASSASSILDASSQSEVLQRKADMANNAAQRVEAPRLNNTGMPDNLKSGIESLSGFSMDDVRVHYNSSKPATVQALAYTQGTDIHVAPGQEKHLPHEAWHVAQQMAGLVSPTTNINGMPVNDNAALEHEADVMGEKAVQSKSIHVVNAESLQISNKPIQCYNIGRVFCATFGDLRKHWKELDEKSKSLLEAKYLNQENDLYDNVNVGDCNDINSVIERILETNPNVKKEDMKDDVFAESHNFSTYAKYTDMDEKNKFDQFWNSFYFEDFMFRWRKNGILFKNIQDLKSQFAHEYKLHSLGYGDELGKKIKHQYDDYSASKKGKRTHLKVYRTLKNGKRGVNYTGATYDNLTPSRSLNLFEGGHGGSIGEALYYYNAFKKDYNVVLIECTINVDLDETQMSNGGEGKKEGKHEQNTILPALTGGLFSLSFDKDGIVEKKLKDWNIIMQDCEGAVAVGASLGNTIKYYC